jgi:hypothetical protein
MDFVQQQDPERKAFVNLLAGFFGVVGAFLILPRALRFFSKRFAFGIISEIITVMITGLLTEKLVSVLSANGDPSAKTAGRRPSRH